MTEKPSKTKRIVVDLSAKRVAALEGKDIAHDFEWVSGDSGHPTPTGKFLINRKEHPYRSRKYGSRMDYAMFFTLTGEALHQYQGPSPWLILRTARSLSDWFSSRGCVRLEADSARTLVEWAPMDTLVEVRGAVSAGTPDREPSPASPPRSRRGR